MTCEVNKKAPYNFLRKAGDFIALYYINTREKRKSKKEWLRKKSSVWITARHISLP
jgi:hypothetical protein